jgi:hypothetical protein
LPDLAEINAGGLDALVDQPVSLFPRRQER